MALSGLTLTGWRRRFRPVRRVATLALVALVALLWPAEAAAQSAIEYYHTDALGSVRAVTKQVNGEWQVVSRHDFMSFGEEVAPLSPPPADKRLFTGKERDQETGLDYFEARYLRAGNGRFTTPDLPEADQSLDDPQSWGLYTYVRNNPLRWVDPTGRELRLAASLTKTEKQQLNAILVEIARRPEGAEVLKKLAASSEVVEIAAGALPDRRLPDGTIARDFGQINQTKLGVQITIDLVKIASLDPLKEPARASGVPTVAHELFHANSYFAAPNDGTSRWRFVGAGDKPTSQTGSAEKWALNLFNAKKVIKPKEATKMVQGLVKQ